MRYTRQADSGFTIIELLIVIVVIAVLATIGTAAGVDLSSLRTGDARGNPYTFDENEGESGNFCATDSSIIYFTSNGVATQTILPIPKHLPPC